MNEQNRTCSLPCRAGVGLREEHFDAILATDTDCNHNHVHWFEFHPENYMGDGGAPHYYLTRVADRFPLSMHGVGLSIGGAKPLDRDHLKRLKTLNDRYQPALVSEHLAWSSHDTGFLNDLLPLPFNNETLAIVCDHLDQLQTYLKKQVLLENPSSYLAFHNSDMDEVSFLKAVVARTGCGLLLDINNVFVSANNMGWSASQYIEAFPFEAVGEIHLAGHEEQSSMGGDNVLIDTHDRAVSDDVWSLYETAINKTGPIPTLIEWDANIPTWPVLVTEAQRADDILLDMMDRRYANAG